MLYGTSCDKSCCCRSCCCCRMLSVVEGWRPCCRFKARMLISQATYREISREGPLDMAAWLDVFWESCEVTCKERRAVNGRASQIAYMHELAHDPNACLLPDFPTSTSKQDLPEDFHFLHGNISGRLLRMVVCAPFPSLVFTFTTTLQHRCNHSNSRQSSGKTAS